MRNRILKRQFSQKKKMVEIVFSRDNFLLKKIVWENSPFEETIFYNKKKSIFSFPIKF